MSAEACPNLPLGYDLEQFAAEKLATSEDLSKCLTEQAVKLSAATGSNDELARAATAACGPTLGMFETQATVKDFERGSLDAEGAKQRVRKEAERFALTRIIQVRAGECKKVIK